MTYEELFARIEKLGGCSGCGTPDGIVDTSHPKGTGAWVRAWVWVADETPEERAERERQNNELSDLARRWAPADHER
jgi:hypothetical protein